MKVLHICALIAVCLSSVSAERLLMLNNSRESPTAQDPLTLWSLDTKTLQVKKISSTDYDMPSWSGSIVCNNTYFSVWADINQGGIGISQVDLSTGAWGCNVVSDHLYHALTCIDSTVYGISTVPNPAKHGVTYSIRKANAQTCTDEEIMNLDAITNYWDGYDNIFSFSQDGKTLWASFPTKPSIFKRHGGILVEVDILNANITGQMKYEGHEEPYYLVPPTNSSSSSSLSSFAIMKYLNADDTIASLNFNPLTFSGNNIRYKKGVEVDFMWSSSEPQKLCNGVVFSLGLGEESDNPPQHLYGMDAQTGKKVLDVNLNDVIPGAFVGGISCY